MPASDRRMGTAKNARGPGRPKKLTNQELIKPKKEKFKACKKSEQKKKVRASVNTKRSRSSTTIEANSTTAGSGDRKVKMKRGLRKSTYATRARDDKKVDPGAKKCGVVAANTGARKRSAAVSSSAGVCQDKNTRKNNPNASSRKPSSAGMSVPRAHHGRRRLASLNALAMVHMLYENDDLNKSRVNSLQQRKRKSDNDDESGQVIDTRFVKRLANLNAQAMMAASCAPAKKRPKKVAKVLISESDALLDNNNNNAKKGVEKIALQGDKVIEVAYTSPPPPYHSIEKGEDFCNASGYIPKMTCQQQQTLTAGQRVSSLQGQSSVPPGQSYDGSLIGHQFAGQFHAGNQSFGQQHSSVPYNYYQPAGPLLQAVPDHFGMIHKPVAYHPHQFSDLQHQMTANHPTFLSPDACHNMTTLHQLQPCIPDKCPPTIHHVPHSQPYNQITNEVTSMPPRLQPLRTAQQHIALNKNDSYTYPPPPILPQPQFYTSGTYQIADYATTTPQLQNFTPTLPPALNLSSENIIKLNQISKTDRESYKQFQFGNQKMHTKTNMQKILPCPETKCSTTILKSEYCHENKPKTSENYPLCLVSRQCDYISNCASVKLKDGSREQIKAMKVCKDNKKQTTPLPEVKCPIITKVRKKLQNPKKKTSEADIKTSVNKKKSAVSAVCKPSIVKVNKIYQNNKVTKHLTHRPMPEKLPLVERTPASKKVKTKRLCEGWRWSGDGKKKLVYLNNEDGAVMRMCYPAMQHVEGDIVKERDSILVCSGARKTDIPYIAKISALWENTDDGEMMMSLLWYYRPEQTEHGRKPHHIDQEIFASKHRDSNSVACIEDKCYVLTYAEYCRYRAEMQREDLGFEKKIAVVPVPPGGYSRADRLPMLQVSPDRVFMCRKVYDYRQKRCLKNPV